MEIIKTVETLGDLTGNPDDINKPLPQVWIDWLCETFPEPEAQKKIEMPPPPKKGRLHMLIPKITIVLRLKPFLWELLKSGARLMSLAEIQKGNLSLPTEIITGTSILESLKKMKDNFIHLEEEKGEHCTYVALVNSINLLDNLQKHPVQSTLYNM